MKRILLLWVLVFTCKQVFSQEKIKLDIQIFDVSIETADSVDYFISFKVINKTDYNILINSDMVIVQSITDSEIRFDYESGYAMYANQPDLTPIKFKKILRYEILEYRIHIRFLKEDLKESFISNVNKKINISVLCGFSESLDDYRVENGIYYVFYNSLNSAFRLNNILGAYY